MYSIYIYISIVYVCILCIYDEYIYIYMCVYDEYIYIYIMYVVVLVTSHEHCSKLLLVDDSTHYILDCQNQIFRIPIDNQV